MASGDLGTFSVKDCHVAMGIYIFKGFHDDMIRVTQDEDTVADHEGADGETCRVIRIKSKITITAVLTQSSATNDALSLLHEIDKRENKPVPFIFRDASGRTVIESPEAWVVKAVDYEVGSDVKVREWTIRAANAVMYIGGNN
jgi:hypothetical protein